MVKNISLLFLVFIFSSIRAEIEDLALAYGDEDFVSIATGKNQLVAKAPAVATVITSNDIQAMGAVDIDDIFNSLPGIHVGINEFYNSIYNIRGINSKFNSQVLILIDGVPIKTLFFGNKGAVAWGGMPVQAIERIEIIRGPGSAVYGADALSGTINIITKKYNDIDADEIGLIYGSYNSNSVWYNSAQQWNGFDLSLTLQALSTDGQSETVEADLQSILDSLQGTNVSYAPGGVNNSRDSFDLRLNLQKGLWETRLGLTERQNIGTGAGVAEALDPEGKFKGSRRNLDIIYNNPEFSDTWSLESQINYFYTTQEIDENLILFPPGTINPDLGGPFPDGMIGNPEVIENHWRWHTSAFYDGFKSHQIRLGAGYYDLDITEVKESKNFALDADGNFINPGDPLAVVDDSPFIFLPEGSRTNKYVFVQDIWQLHNDVELTYGVRFDEYSDFGSTTNPRYALVWSMSNNLTSKFLYGKAFRAPSFSELENQNNPVTLGNPDLDPEEIETIELVLDYQASLDQRYGINIFSYEWKDIIDYIQDSGATTSTAQNDGEQDGKGVELEYEWQVSNDFSFLANYSYLDTERDGSGSINSNAPKNQIYLRMKMQLTEYYSYTNQLYAISSRERTETDAREDLNGYTWANMSLLYSNPQTNWQYQLTVNNVLDDKIYEPHTVNIPNDLPLAGRNFYFTIKYNFN